jgi:hypothetical protein
MTSSPPWSFTSIDRRDGIVEVVHVSQDAPPQLLLRDDLAP